MQTINNIINRSPEVWVSGGLPQGWGLRLPPVPLCLVGPGEPVLLVRLKLCGRKTFSSVQFSPSVVSDFATPCTTACQASLSITNSRSLPKLMSIESVMRETQVQSLDREDPLEKEMATHSSILAWRIPWTEEPGSLQSIRLQSLTLLSGSHLAYINLMLTNI